MGCSSRDAHLGRKTRIFHVVVGMLLFCSFVMGAEVKESPSLWSHPRSWWRFVRNKPCPYVPNKAESVKNALNSVIRGQTSAIANITSAISLWADDLEDQPRPLIMVLTGPTGVGKSETARAIASGLLANRVALEGPAANGATAPEGFLELRGEDYVDTANITKLQMTLRDEIARVLYNCRGQVVILIDEAQKAAKEAFSILSPLFQGTHATFSHPEFSQPLDATRLILIIISDIGVPEIEEYVQSESAALAALQQQANPGSTTTVTSNYAALQRRLTSQMRARVTEEFKPPGDTLGLDLGALADTIVAFMPFNQTGAMSLLAKGLGALATKPGIRNHVHEVVWTNDALAYMTLPRHLRYNTDSVRGAKPATTASGGALVNRCAADMKRMLEDRVSSAASGKGSRPSGSSSSSSSSSSSVGVEADGSTSSTSSSSSPSIQVCGEPCDLPRSCIVRYGGREILHHKDRSPVSKLQSLLKTHLAEFPRIDKKKDGKTDFEKEPRNVARIDVKCDAVTTLDGTCRLPGLIFSLSHCIVHPASSNNSEECTLMFEGEL